jgi:hypothetical protein
MFLQKVLKGIARLTRDDADESFREGIYFNWWRASTRLLISE